MSHFETKSKIGPRTARGGQTPGWTGDCHPGTGDGSIYTVHRTRARGLTPGGSKAGRRDVQVCITSHDVIQACPDLLARNFYPVPSCLTPGPIWSWPAPDAGGNGNRTWQTSWALEAGLYGVPCMYIAVVTLVYATLPQDSLARTRGIGRPPGNYSRAGAVWARAIKQWEKDKAAAEVAVYLPQNHL